jgi:hypothetical protein|tara:strand:- start:1573 stop:1962 length:390 start_codon:yes stop_codon:yes gene_type:complete
MTRKENTGIRCKEFSKWIRKNLPNSNTGFMVFDVDFVMYNRHQKTIIIIEEKTYGNECTFAQNKFLKLLDDIFCSGSISLGYKYKGYYTIIFENECFYDGEAIIINNKTKKQKKISEKEFKNFIDSKLN